MADLLERVRASLAGRYTIERELGRGGMATVYLAEDLKHHRKVAVKVLKPELAATLGEERFFREIHVAAQLQHPHILPLLDSGEADGFFYYVMPYVEGESLRERLAQHGELPVHDAVRILSEVVDALAHAHQHGVVHRDIKPDNILLSGRHALVMDFGVAKAVSEATGREQLTTAGVALGTPAYMAPEQAAADPHLDHRVDIYAVGVLAYELLTGRPPFVGLTPQEVLAAHVTQAPEPVERHRPALAPALSQVVMRCIAKRAADRWQTAEELLTQLEPLTTPSGGTTPTGTQPIPAPAARANWGRAAAAVGLLGVFGVGILLWRGRSLNVVELGRTTQVTLDPGLEIDPALSPDRRFIAYVAGRPGRTNLFVRQVDGGLPIRVVADQGEQRFPTWSPDGERLLFVSTRGIEIVPALGGLPRVLVAGAGTGADSKLRPGPIARDGRAFVFASTDSVFVKPLDGGEAHLVTAAWEPHSFAWSPDGRWIAYASGNSQYVAARYLGNFAPSSIWVVAAVGGTPIRVTGAQWLNVSPAWLPGGSLLYISNRDGGRDVYQVGLTRAGTPAGPPRRVTTGLNAHTISVSADGTRLAYSAFTETSNVWSVLPSLTGVVSVSQAQPVTKGNQTIEAFDISRDGRWLVFDSNRNGVQQIYRVPLGGGEAQRLTNDSGGALWPRWSPDGREIAFQTFHGGRRQAYVASAEGEGVVQVSASADDERGPTWAPDGERLLTLGSWPTQPRWHVFTRNASRAWSAGEQVLLVIGSDTVPPSVGDWSPDGRMLACGCGDQGLVTVPAAGGPARRLVAGSAVTNVAYPAWSTDGQAIYYITRESGVPVNVSVVPAVGGTPRVVVRFDDPTRPWHRYGLRVHGERVYFTLGDLQSDIWVAELEHGR